MKVDYTTYGPYEFVADNDFKSWVLNPTREKEFYWRAWLANHTEKSNDVAAAREIILSINFSKTGTVSSKKKSIYANIINQAKQENEAVRFKQNSIRRYIKIAAFITLAIACSIVLWSKFSGIEAPMALSSQEFIERETRRGEKLTLTLSDGTTVNLNAKSKIKFPRIFDKNREVELTGEAYFDVQRNIHKPFLVRTGEVTTEVLGTSFNVNYSPGDSSVQVAVTSGKVAVRQESGTKTYDLLPTELLVYKSDTFTKGHFDRESLLAWKDWVLVFDNANIYEITDKLENWFDVDFEVVGQHAVQRKFSGKFKNPSLKQVLDGISYTSKFDYTINNKQILIQLN